MNYISTKELINEVRDRLKTWENRFDDSIFYPVFRKCLSAMGTKYLPQERYVVEVRGSTGKLPDNFQKLIVALGCYEQVSVTVPPEVQHTEETYDVYEPNLYQIHVDDCGVPYQIIRKYSVGIANWTQFEILGLTNTNKSLLDNSCININHPSDNSITIKNGYIYTNFDEGLIYLDYYAKLEDESGYLIPENEVIIEWVKAEMIYMAFSTLKFNNVPGLDSHIQLALAELTHAKSNARGIIHLSEVSDFYDLRNALVNRYKTLGYGIIGHTRHDRR